MSRRITPSEVASTLTIAIPVALSAVIDAEVARLTASGVKATRSDVARVALTRGMLGAAGTREMTGPATGGGWFEWMRRMVVG